MLELFNNERLKARQPCRYQRNKISMLLQAIYNARLVEENNWNYLVIARVELVKSTLSTVHKFGMWNAFGCKLDLERQ